MNAGKKKKVTPITTPLKSNRICEIVQEWYANFVDVDQTLLFELVTAANFMDIKALLDLTCLAVSVLIKVREDTYSRMLYIFIYSFVIWFCMTHGRLPLLLPAIPRHCSCAYIIPIRGCGPIHVPRIPYFLLPRSTTPPAARIHSFAPLPQKKGKSAEEIRRIFNISNDFSPDEWEEAPRCEDHS